MNELFYPTIDLFVYDLRSPLNADVGEIANNTQSFQARLPEKVTIKDVDSEPEYLELTTPPRPKLNPANASLEGYFFPVCLNDTYGLQIDCSVNNLTEPQPIDSFRVIKEEVERYAYPNPLTIGKTWLILGWLSSQDQDSESTARDCYHTLFPDQVTPEIQGKGTFLGGSIFEVWQAQSYDSEHLVIILFPDRVAAEKAANFYKDWIGLFCYRHKITWAYHQSRLIKKALVNHYKKVGENTEIIKNSQNLKVNLASLQKLFHNIQNILNKYTIDLLNLSFQKQIIEINLVNYRTRLEFIKQKAGQESDLSFLDNFANLAEKKYLPQIAKDNDNLQLGLQLLETNINALRSQIELEKSERDRNFQNIVTLVGTGTAITAFFDYKAEKCKAIFSVSEKTSHPCNKPLIGTIIFPITFLLVIGGIAFLLKWLYIKIK